MKPKYDALLGKIREDDLDGDSFTVTNTSTDNAISVDQNGNVGTDVGTDGAIHVENTGNTGIGLGVYSNLGATADGPLLHVKANDAAFDQYSAKFDGGTGVQIGVGGSTPDLVFGDSFKIRGSSGAAEVRALFNNKDFKFLDENQDIRLSYNMSTGRIDMSNMEAEAFKFPADATDPTSGGGAAAGRIPIDIGGTTFYLPYYS